mmetsp:Transcript_18712/g.40231  ORF Transcript_18712/g.40231 Transcript_18712/m.40231 type:complete len:296 (-) Transcript_18712:1273-2160(-)
MLPPTGGKTALHTPAHHTCSLPLSLGLTCRQNIASFSHAAAVVQPLGVHSRSYAAALGFSDVGLYHMFMHGGPGLPVCEPSHMFTSQMWAFTQAPCIEVLALLDVGMHVVLEHKGLTHARKQGAQLPQHCRAHQQAHRPHHVQGQRQGAQLQHGACCCCPSRHHVEEGEKGQLGAHHCRAGCHPAQSLKVGHGAAAAGAALGVLLVPVQQLLPRQDAGGCCLLLLSGAGQHVGADRGALSELVQPLLPHADHEVGLGGHVEPAPAALVRLLAQHSLLLLEQHGVSVSGLHEQQVG